MKRRFESRRIYQHKNRIGGHAPRVAALLSQSRNDVDDARDFREVEYSSAGDDTGADSPGQRWFADGRRRPDALSFLAQIAGITAIDHRTFSNGSRTSGDFDKNDLRTSARHPGICRRVQTQEGKLICPQPFIFYAPPPR